ncbi:MAG: hypothetical protein FWC67_05300 [Defluviitaleaceae bacterium]|nr:hypothetical protein [Defluviitaleaceae bacterium]
MSVKMAVRMCWRMVAGFARLPRARFISDTASALVMGLSGLNVLSP